MIVKLQGLDASENQPRLAREAILLSALPDDHRFETRSLPDNDQIDADLCISSYWFCENRDIYKSADALRMLVHNCLLIVDYKEVIEDAAVYLPSGYRMTESLSLQVSVPDQLLEFIGQSTTTVHFGVVRHLS